jgi:hypothetical protein
VSEIEDSTKTGAVGPGATGPRVLRAQILLDRARFSPGEIDGVYGDDFGIADLIGMAVRNRRNARSWSEPMAESRV